MKDLKFVLYIHEEEEKKKQTQLSERFALYYIANIGARYCILHMHEQHTHTLTHIYCTNITSTLQIYLYIITKLKPINHKRIINI